MTQPISPPARHILTAISTADSSPTAVAAAVNATFTTLLAQRGETLASYSPDQPLDPDRFAIPAVQWDAITGACLARASAFGGSALASMDLINLMPATYPDPAVTVTIPPPADQWPPELTLTVTRQAADVIAAASARCTDFATSYGPASRQHLDALRSWERQLARLFLMSFGAAATITRDDDLSLLIATSSGFTYGLIFHPDRRTCTVPARPVTSVKKLAGGRAAVPARREASAPRLRTVCGDFVGILVAAACARGMVVTLLPAFPQARGRADIAGWLPR